MERTKNNWLGGIFIACLERGPHLNAPRRPKVVLKASCPWCAATMHKQPRLVRESYGAIKI